MYLQFNCNYRCWECSRKCMMKNLFSLEDNLFYSMIIKSLKFSAGMMITRGYSKEMADFELKKMAVTLKISRELTLDNNSKS